jgi:hypothetical protein
VGQFEISSWSPIVELVNDTYWNIESYLSTTTNIVATWVYSRRLTDGVIPGPTINANFSTLTSIVIGDRKVGFPIPRFMP